MENKTKIIREVCFGNEPTNDNSRLLIRNDRKKSTTIICKLVTEYNCPNCEEVFSNEESVEETIKSFPKRCPKCKVLWIVEENKW